MRTRIRLLVVHKLMVYCNYRWKELDDGAAVSGDHYGHIRGKDTTGASSKTSFDKAVGDLRKLLDELTGKKEEQAKLASGAPTRATRSAATRTKVAKC